MNNVLTFKRDGEYILRRAAVNRKDGRLLEALKLTRRAAEMEPGNLECWMSMAQTLCEMGLYSQSLRVLCLMLSVPGAPTDCYFGMGCNFLGQDKPDAAFGAMLNLIARDPASLGRPDVQEILGDITQAKFSGRYELRENRREDRLCRRASQLLDEGKSSLALELSRRAFLRDGDFDAAQREYARALAASGDIKNAAIIIDKAIKNEEAELKTILEAVKIHTLAGDGEVADEIAARLISRQNPFPQELLICLEAACVRLNDEAVARLAARALRDTPFDTRLLHVCAVNRVRLSRSIEQAASFWTRATSIDPEDAVSKYYLKTLASGNIDHAITYEYALPESEADRLKGIVKKAQTLSTAELDVRLSTPGDTRDACLWALHACDGGLRLLSSELLRRSGNHWARRKLAESLAWRYEKSFASLSGASSARTQAFGLDGASMPPVINRAVRLAFDFIGEMDKTKKSEGISRLCEAALPMIGQRELRRYGNADVWAAVIVCKSLSKSPEKADIPLIAARFGCPARRVKRCLNVYDSFGGNK